jgi:hypothetical protein
MAFIGILFFSCSDKNEITEVKTNELTENTSACKLATVASTQYSPVRKFTVN